MQSSELNNVIIRSITKLNHFQQIKLLEFINAMSGKSKAKASVLQKFAGCIEKSDLQLMKDAIARDCEKVDYNEW
jgi:hypothetical protein